MKAFTLLLLVSITLMPLFYKTMWFYALCVLLLGWAGYTAFRVRTRSIQARNIRLQAEVGERKQVVAALRASEERFSKAFQAAPIPMILNTVETGRCIDVNQYLLDLFGFRRDEVVGKTMEELAFWDDSQDRVRMIETMRAQGRVREMAARFRTKTGERRDVLLSVEFVEFSGQRCLLGVAQDVTKRNRAEVALRASEEKFSKAFRASPDAIIISSLPDGEILDVNDGFWRISGFDRDEVIGYTTIDLGVWVDLADRDRILEILRMEGRVRDYECSLRTKSGEIRLCLDSAEIIEFEGKQRLLSVLRDVTEQKQVAEEREELISELEARNAELERFTYTVSHDLKSPLVTIKGFLGLLRKDAAAGDTEQVDHDIARIGNAADTMTRLLDELLELSRIGRLMNPPEEVDLTGLAREAATLVAGQIEERSATVAIPEEMPVVYGDRVRLLEVYQNLIDNAVKFMGAQPEPCIEVGARQEGDEVVCFVRDNGMGIAPRYHEKVFGLFDQLNPDEEGTGIGLALVRRIVEVHGGKIWVESEGEGHGAIFYFSLSSKSMPREDAF